MPPATWNLTKMRALNRATQRCLGYPMFPYKEVIGLAGKVIDGVKAFVMDTVATPEQQRKAAIDIIRAAKEANADEVEFTMDQEVAIGLKANGQGMKFELGPSRGSSMRIKVKFK